MKSQKRIFLIFFMIILSIGADRLTKEIVRSDLPGTKPLTLLKGMLTLDYVENKGGVFTLEGLLPKMWRGKTATMGVAVLLGLGILFLMIANGLRFPTVLGLSLFLGGGLSNLFDRIAFGGVVDFVKFGLVGLRPYIFNLADVEIGIGITIVIFSIAINFVKAGPFKFIERVR
jgi:signal peptidase II